jgi:co-chaperonin GroES (HSP10)
MDVSFEPWQLRPKKDWVVICLDKRKTELSSGLIIPVETNHEKLHEGSGYIIRIGVGPIAEAEKLGRATRILFRSYLKYIHPLNTTKTYADGEPVQYALVSLEDVIAEIDPDVEIGLLSERKDK